MTVKSMPKQRILILDFGSQYTQLIARRIRELGVYCELHSWKMTEAQIRQFDPMGIVLSGGPESAANSDSPMPDDYVFNSGVPVLGVCYGMQIMALRLGGNVEAAHSREFGHADTEIIASCPLTNEIQDRVNSTGTPVLSVWMSHGDQVTSLPPGFVAIAKTKSCPFTIIANEKQHLYGIQFHPEVTHTPRGVEILKRFVFSICQCERLWTPAKILDELTDRVHQHLDNDKVILALSGGVDSSVTALLLHRAIGDRLICIFVDNGLLRLNEVEQVMTMFKQFNLNIILIRAENRFLEALKDITDPEIKRKIIGRLFIEIFDEESAKLSGISWLAQGTIYPDVIESAGSAAIGAAQNHAHVIKSHHNVGGLPKNMTLKLIEPLRTLFKDEVRNIGLELGLPREMLWRHPFPGPGLGVRILGEVKKSYCELLRLADAIFIEELRKADLYHKVSQAFAVFLPVRSVGVMGDGRKYDWVIALRAVETSDFMTANWAELPYELLRRTSTRITNEIEGISRVVYDVSGKPPATIEWE